MSFHVNGCVVLLCCENCFLIGWVVAVETNFSLFSLNVGARALLMGNEENIYFSLS